MSRVGVYVAAKFEEKATAARLMEMFRRHLFVVTCDWTNEDERGMTGKQLRQYRTENGVRDLRGVCACDVFVILPHPMGRGSMTELGIALALHKRVIVIGDPAQETNEFLLNPNIEWAGSCEAAVALASQ